MERWSELALGTNIQFLFVHMQFNLLNEAISEAGLLAMQQWLHKTTSSTTSEKSCVSN